MAAWKAYIERVIDEVTPEMWGKDAQSKNFRMDHLKRSRSQNQYSMIFEKKMATIYSVK